ncbi:unnamed protein product [Urochloa decumbens]|uniref:F-box domain-containing protein n=1 Tax=Urochloa decumbens TaxID=240449 RepID=A0ABC8VNA5_9POAL
MPPGRRGKRGNQAPMEGSGRTIDIFPDGVFQHILGFLPARDAVRTCVLARRWCDLWMFATGLRIIGNEDDDMGELREFVDHLLLNRGTAPLKHSSSGSTTYVFISFSIFKRDLRRCPTFSKLKTLLLNDYLSLGLDLDAITCILKHSPVLEKLTLELFPKGSHHKMEIKVSYSPPVQTIAAISEHLKMVEVKCEVVDERVYKVLKLLCTFSIRFSFE